MASLLFGVKPSDPLTLGVAATMLVSVALAACYIPARRAWNRSWHYGMRRVETFGRHLNCSHCPALSTSW